MAPSTLMASEKGLLDELAALDEVVELDELEELDELDELDELELEELELDELDELEELGELKSAAAVELELLLELLLEDEKTLVPVPFTVIEVAMPIPLSGFCNSSGTWCDGAARNWRWLFHKSNKHSAPVSSHRGKTSRRDTCNARTIPAKTCSAGRNGVR